VVKIRDVLEALLPALVLAEELGEELLLPGFVLLEEVLLLGVIVPGGDQRQVRFPHARRIVLGEGERAVDAPVVLRVQQREHAAEYPEDDDCVLDELGNPFDRVKHVCRLLPGSWSCNSRAGLPTGRANRRSRRTRRIGPYARVGPSSAAAVRASSVP